MGSHPNVPSPPYIFRVAISNSRIVSLDNDQVTFRYRASDIGQTKFCTLDVEEFIRRFLQHVLPKGFVKVRYAARGLLSPGARQSLALVRQQLTPAAVEPVMPAPATPEPLTTAHPSTQDSDSVAATPDPIPPAAQPDTASLTSPSSAGTLSPDQSVLAELEDEPASPDEPATPAPPSSAPCCPTCGQPMQRRASLLPKGCSPP